MIALRLRHSLRDVVLTTGNAFLLAGCILVLTRLLVNGLGKSQFGTYLMAHRVAGLMSFLFGAGAYWSLPRFLAPVREDPTGRVHVYQAVVRTWGVVVIIGAVGAYVFRGALSSFIFRQPHSEELWLATVARSISFASGACLAATFRGLRKHLWSNATQLFFDGLVPIAVAGALASIVNVETLLSVLALTGIATALVLLGNLLLGPQRTSPVPQGLPSRITIGLYGISRIPAGLLLSLVLLLPVFFVGGPAAQVVAGLMLVGQVPFSLAERMLYGWLMVSLPRTSELISKGMRDHAGRQFSEILTAGFQVGPYIAVHMVIWSKLLLEVWLGPQMLDAAPYLWISAAVFTPWILYVMGQPVLDAERLAPHNTVNLLIAITLEATCLALLVSRNVSPLWLYAVTLPTASLLAFLTLRPLLRAFSFGWRSLRLPTVVIGNVLLGAMALGVSYAMESQRTSVRVVTSVLIEIICALAYVWIMLRTEAPWISNLKARLTGEDPNPFPDGDRAIR